MILMQCIFLFEIGLDITIMIYMYGTNYFQMSASFFGVIYFIGMLALCIYIGKSESWSNINTSCCIIYACAIIIIPIGIPIYISIAALCVLYESNTDLLIIFNILSMVYIVPQNLIHWMIVIVYSMDYNLYLLISMAMLDALIYYILFIS